MASALHADIYMRADLPFITPPNHEICEHHKNKLMVHSKENLKRVSAEAVRAPKYPAASRRASR